MNDSLLCYFSFNNNFYEVFTDKKSKFYCKKISTKDSKNSISDQEILKSVINKISKMKYVYFDTIKYGNERLKLYFNTFNQKIYMSKLENQNELACDYFSYKEVYDLYNNPVIYNYQSLDNPDIFDGFNFPGESLADNNSAFGSKNTGAFTTSFGSPTNNSTYKSEPLSPSGVFVRPSNFNNMSLNNHDEELRRKEQELAEKRNAKKRKVIRLVIASVVVSVVVVSAVALITKFKSNNITDVKDPVEQGFSIDEQVVDSDDAVLQEIIDTLQKQGEEPWVIEQVIQQYKEQNGIADHGSTSINNSQIEDPSISVETQRIIDSINNNPNLQEDEKLLIIRNFTHYFELNKKYIDLDRICDTFSTLQFAYDIQENVDLEEFGRFGEYDPGTNKIVIFSDQEKVKTHEVGHAIGDLGVVISTNKLSEGYTELFNPNRDRLVYSAEQNMVLILEQIYGKDFMRKAYFNRSLFSDMYDRFGLDKTQDSNPHWNIITKCNSFLNTYSDYALGGYSSNETVLGDIKGLLSELRTEYEGITGKKWDENPLLKICHDRFTGENTSGRNLSKSGSIRDVYIDSEGNYVYTVGKGITMLIENTNISPQDYINGNAVFANFDSYSFDVTSEPYDVMLDSNEIDFD